MKMGIVKAHVFANPLWTKAIVQTYLIPPLKIRGHEHLYFASQSNIKGSPYFLLHRPKGLPDPNSCPACPTCILYGQPTLKGHPFPVYMVADQPPKRAVS